MPQFLLPIRYKLYRGCFHTAIALTIGDELHELQTDAVYPKFPTLFAVKEFDDILTEIGVTSDFEDIETVCARCSNVELKRREIEKSILTRNSTGEARGGFAHALGKGTGTLTEFVNIHRH
ncbi:hypothetical protein TWF281_004271 [Arthrobotrys megalospora]